MTEYRFLQPLDVLYLRGNRLFEGAGAYGAALMPPWPSLAAGAIRSRMLADASVDLRAFATGSKPSGPLGEVLGTPVEPGSFRVTGFTLGRRVSDSAGGEVEIEPYFPLPADVAVTAQALGDATYLYPTTPHPALRTGAPLGQFPLLRVASPAKPIGGLWLSGAGLKTYLGGDALQKEHLLHSAALWQSDPRLGIALEGAHGRAEPGMLYTAEAVALKHGVGFVAGVGGADGALPEDGLLRLGGDGRGAAVSPCNPQWPGPDWDRIEQEGRFRIVLATPGLFEGGWRLPGSDAEGVWHGPADCQAHLVAAAINRAETVSGWDLAKGASGNGDPKSSLRAAPVGAVYWLQGLQGGTAGLRKLAAAGFWALSGHPDGSRKAEGFNNLMVANWPVEHD